MFTQKLKPGATFILGGARSGKSSFAERLAQASGLERHYVATGRAWDDEMRARISKHQADRAGEWRTHEAPLDLCRTLGNVIRPGRVVLVDCLTLWVTNLMMEEQGTPALDAAFDGLVSTLSSAPAPVIVVSNEVGLGIVPDNSMARAFRDHAGRLHQKIAAVADDVYFVAAGLPLKMKG